MMGQDGERDSISTSGSAVLEALNRTLDQARRSDLYRERVGAAPLRDVAEFRKLPLTTRADLESAGVTGTRAAPLEEVCHYGETSGTSSGKTNSTWLTHEDLAGNARTIAQRHPEIFGPGRILLNRFPFMAAPAHLIQLIAQQGGGIAVPAGNINWDVPFPRALDLAQRTGVNVLAGLPLEPIVLAGIAEARGLDPKRDFAIDTFFLGGAPLPPNLQKRIERIWGARVVEHYGSTETMLLGTACRERTLHLEPDLVHAELLELESDEPAKAGDDARLVITTLAIEGSPLLRFETGDIVRKLPPCPCGDPRQAVIVLGRAGDVVELSGRRLHGYEIIDAAAAAADAVDSSVFFTVVLPDRLVVRIESPHKSPSPGPAQAALGASLGDLPTELEFVPPNSVLDVEHIGRSPSVYKPSLVSDWTKPGRHIVNVHQGMMEWPSLGLGEAARWLSRGAKSALRKRRLSRGMRVANPPGR